VVAGVVIDVVADVVVDVMEDMVADFITYMTIGVMAMQMLRVAVVYLLTTTYCHTRHVCRALLWLKDVYYSR